MGTRAKALPIAGWATIAVLLLFLLGFAAPTAFADSSDSLTASSIAIQDDDPANANTPIDISEATVSEFEAKAYTGEPQTQDITVCYGETPLVEDEDYTIEYANNVDIGVATVTITGINNYAGTYEGSFIIYGDLSDATIAGIPNKTYTGSAINPVPQVTIADKALVAETDFELTYENNEDAGEAAVTVTGKGDYYRNSRSATFVIDAAPIGKAKATLAAKTFTGKALSPSPVLKFNSKTLKKGTAYTLSFKNSKRKAISAKKIVAAGTYYVVVKGTKNFKGTRTLKLTVKKAAISKTKVASIAAKTYKGKAFKPSPKVKLGKVVLKKGKHYTLSYKANKAAGTAKVIIKGKGSLKGTKTVKFKIKRASVSKAKVSAIGSQKYTGSAIKPAPSVSVGGRTLKAGKDYALSYASNVNAGTAKIYITGKGNYTGKRTVSFKIWKPAPVAPVSDTVYITKSGECYHRDGCSSLSRSKIAISRSDAVSRGYRPCKRCNP